PDRWRSSDTQDEDAGVQTCGAGPPSVLSFQPAARASSAAPDALLMIFTSTHLPSKVRPLLLYRSATALSSADFSLDAATPSATQPLRVAAFLPPSPPP